jgi:phosphatidylglycerol:prolipoprotein diacylglycerol transferase
MLTHPDFNPVAFSVGPLHVHWYGLMYLLGFLCFWLLAHRRLRDQPYAGFGWGLREIEDLLFAGVLGVILGGRLGYVLFYQPGYYLAHPAHVIAVWDGGMSFHGGLLGVMVAAWWFARTRRVAWLDLLDFAAPMIPPGLGFGRLGNFINGELWGRAAPAWWPGAMVYPQSGSLVARFPSELYEALLEGLLLFLVLWWLARKPRARGFLTGCFGLGYGLARIVSECFREPDAFLGFLWSGLTMGQLLSLPLVLGGIALIVWSRADRR